MTILRLSLLIFIALSQTLVACDKGKSEESDEPSPRPQVSTEESFATGIGYEEEQGTMFRPPQVSTEESTDITEQIREIMAASSDSRSDEGAPMSAISRRNLEMKDFLETASALSHNLEDWDAIMYSTRNNNDTELQRQLRLLERDRCLAPGKAYRISVTVTPPRRKVATPIPREASQEMIEMPFSAIKANSYSDRSSLFTVRNQDKALKKNYSDSSIRRSMEPVQRPVKAENERNESDNYSVSFDVDPDSLPSPRGGGTKKVWSPRKEPDSSQRSKIVSPRGNKSNTNAGGTALAPKSSSLNAPWSKYRQKKKEKQLRRTLSDTSVKKKVECSAAPSKPESKQSPRYINLKPQYGGSGSSTSSRTSPREKGSPGFPILTKLFSGIQNPKKQQKKKKE